MRSVELDNASNGFKQFLYETDFPAFEWFGDLSLKLANQNC